MLTAGIAVLAFLAGVAVSVLWLRSGVAVSGWLTRLLRDIRRWPPGGKTDTDVAAAGTDSEADPGEAHDAELVAPKMEPETVAALLENAKSLAADEQERGASLKQRAGWLLGLLGVTLTLLATQAREFGRSDLGAVGTPLAAVLVLVALVCILNAARWALRTLEVVSIWHVHVNEAKRYPTWAYISKAPEVARGEMLQGWVRQFADERPANDAKATQLQRAFANLTAGICVLAATALIVCLRAFGV